MYQDKTRIRMPKWILWNYFWNMISLETPVFMFSLPRFMFTLLRNIWRTIDNNWRSIIDALENLGYASSFNWQFVLVTGFHEKDHRWDAVKSLIQLSHSAQKAQNEIRTMDIFTAQPIESWLFLNSNRIRQFCRHLVK